MKKLFSLFVILMLVLSFSGLVLAESGSGSGGGNSGSNSGSGDDDENDEDDEDDESEDDCEIGSGDDDCEEEYDDDYSQEIESSTTQISLGQVEGREVCMTPKDLLKDSVELKYKIMEKEYKGELKDAAELKLKLDQVNNRIKQSKEKCLQLNNANAEKLPRVQSTQGSLPVTAVAAGIKCSVPEEFTKELDVAWTNYKNAVSSSSEVSNIDELKEQVKLVEEKIREYKEECRYEIVPGLSKEKRSCIVPKELYAELESVLSKYKNEDSVNSLQSRITPEDKEKIKEIESKIKDFKAKCNAPLVTSEVKEGDLSQYYKAKISEINSEKNPELKIEELKSLRKEIDETIKTLIEQKKKIKFDEVKDVTEKIKLKNKTVSVGDTETESEVEIETEIEGQTVSVSSSESGVSLSEDGVVALAGEATIDSSGITVDGSQVKVTPKEALEKKKYLVKDRVKELKLEKKGEKLVYKANVEVDRKVLGFISAKAKQSVEIDASTGEVISEKKPWWGFLSSEKALETESEVTSETPYE